MDALLAQRLVVPAGASASTGGRPPKTFAFNRNARRRAGRRPRRHALARGGDRPGRRRHRADARGHPDRRRPGHGPGVARGHVRRACWRRAATRPPTCAASASASPVRWSSRPARRSRRRSCPAGTATAWPTDLRAALRRPRARGQRREHHGPRRVLVALARHRAPAVRQGRHRHRLRRDHRRAHPPRRPGRGRRHRPHPRPRPRRRDLPLRQPRLSRGDRRRRRDGGPALPRSASPPRTAATSCATSARAGPRRCASSARPVASSAACWPAP